MKIKPVAWMQVHYKDNRPTKFSPVKVWEDDIPLYTHPVKELTDEEIINIKTLMEINYGCVPPLEFAWAILQKAQEK